MYMHMVRFRFRVKYELGSAVCIANPGTVVNTASGG